MKLNFLKNIFSGENSKFFPYYRQLDSMDCGPTCLRMVAKHYGKFYSIQYLREKCYIDRAGVSLKGIVDAAETIGLRTLAIKLSLPNEGVKNNRSEPSLLEAPLPCIAHWKQNHFIVIYKISNSNVWIADPAIGKLKLNFKEFKSGFCSDNDSGVVLLLEVTPDFYNTDYKKENSKGFSFLYFYLKPYNNLIFQIIIGLIIGTVFQLIFPFLTQSLVDIGIQTHNLGFIHLVLAGQLVLFCSQVLVRFIQSWIILHISTRINVNLIADFLLKMMKLPIGFFDSKNTGDLMQRIGDHKRIEVFLTQSLLNLFLSLMTLFVFSILLFYYSIKIFIIFIFSGFFYVGWVFIFLKNRKEIDYNYFQQLGENHDSLTEIIQGLPEIKLQGSQDKRRWKWTFIQARLFKSQMMSLKISQFQDAGAMSITQLKDIFITFIAATAVLEGKMTLGMMLAVQYIIGQLNVPLQQLVGFIRDAHDASISLERLSEIHDSQNEDQLESSKSTIIPDGNIIFENVSFRYTPINEFVLSDINLTIYRGKTTAIVGTSGSGKTTLIKLLLGFYEPTFGKILVGDIPLQSIYQKAWRSQCGVVMQEGFIFSDTIANNVAESDENTDVHKVLKSLSSANILEFIHGLPLGLNTKIGPTGNGISQGQKQRLLIARAIYKDPEFIFFDEATNALDANNEKIIMQNLDHFLKGKTSIIVAHRLSTVKNADQIIVLDNGKIVESGTHYELIKVKGHYFTLVQNQLELGD